MRTEPAARAALDASAAEHLQTVELNGRLKLAPRRRDYVACWSAVFLAVAFVWSFT